MKGNIWLVPTRSFFHRRAVCFLDEWVPPPECRATGAKWPLHHSFGNLPPSLSPSLLFLFVVAQKHFCFVFTSTSPCWVLLFKKRVVPPFLYLDCLRTQVMCVHSHLVFSWALLGEVQMDISGNLKIRISFEVLGLHALHSWTTKPNSHRCRRVKEDSWWRATFHFFLL